jgi:hypothetical protein
MSTTTGAVASDLEAHGVMRDVRNLFGAALVGGVAVAVLQQMAQSLLGPAIGMAAAASLASALSSASHGRLVHGHSVAFLGVFVLVGTPVVFLAMWAIHKGMMLMGVG